MRAPRGRPTAVIVGVAALLALAGAFVGLGAYLRGVSERNSSRTVSVLLAEADRDIASGFFDHGEREVRQAADAAETLDSWASVAKRAYAIGEGVGDFTFLDTIARRAVAAHPDAEALWALKALAEVRTGRYAAAVADCNRHLGGTRYAGLKTEAVLRAYPAIDPTTAGLDERGALFLKVLRSRSPDDFEELAEETGNDDFLLDALLLSASEGDLAAAYRTLGSLRDNVPAELGMLIGYDSGELDGALAYYRGASSAERTPGMRLLAADIEMLQMRYQDASEDYGRFIALHPDYSWTPYVNFAWISERSGGLGGLSTLEEASRRFPGVKEVALALASAYEAAGMKGRALADLQSYLRVDPADLDASLSFLRLSGRTLSPEGYKAELWKLFYRAIAEDPEAGGRVARYLAWYLLGLRDEQGVSLVLKQTSQSDGAEWHLFYGALLAASQGESGKALALFKRAGALVARPETFYDIGVVELSTEDFPDAIESFRQADLAEQETSEVVQGPERAQIHVKLAEALEGQGEAEAAKRELLYALDIDPSNLEGRLMMRKLDSTGEK